MSRIAVGGMLEVTDLVMVMVQGTRSGPGVAGLALSTLGRHGINVLCVVSSPDATGRENLTIAIGSGDLDQALGLLQPLKEDLSAERIEYLAHNALLSVYGPHFSERPAIAGHMFDALARRGIDIHAVSTSVTTVSCLIDETDLEQARAAIQETFVLP